MILYEYGKTANGFNIEPKKDAAKQDFKKNPKLLVASISSISWTMCCAFQELERRSLYTGWTPGRGRPSS